MSLTTRQQGAITLASGGLLMGTIGIFVEEARLDAMTMVLLRVISLLVPSHERVEWRREWEAEIAHARQARPLSGPANPLMGQTGGAPRRLTAPLSPLAVVFRCLGALEDAFWLRIRRRNRGMLLQDVRYAVRSFAKNPVFTLVVLVTLALGIGANTAIISVLSAVLVRDMPYPDADRLVVVQATRGPNATRMAVSRADERPPPR